MIAVVSKHHLEYGELTIAWWLRQKFNKSFIVSTKIVYYLHLFLGIWVFARNQLIQMTIDLVDIFYIFIFKAYFNFLLLKNLSKLMSLRWIVFTWARHILMQVYWNIYMLIYWPKELTPCFMLSRQTCAKYLKYISKTYNFWWVKYFMTNIFRLSPLKHEYYQ